MNPKLTQEEAEVYEGVLDYFRQPEAGKDDLRWVSLPDRFVFTPPSQHFAILLEILNLTVQYSVGGEFSALRGSNVSCMFFLHFFAGACLLILRGLS